MRSFKTAIAWLACISSLQAQISVVPTVTHLSSAATPSAGAISLAVSGGTSPYSYTWSPGSLYTKDISGRVMQPYMVTIEDSSPATYTYTYGIGYKTAWDQMNGCDLKQDTLVNSGGFTWGRAISKNTLAGGSDGWLEYVLKDLDQTRTFGFLDSLSPWIEDIYDIDYGFYCSGIDGRIYIMTNGFNGIPVAYNPPEGTVFRIERRGDTIDFKINGLSQASVIDHAAVQRTWKIKGNVFALNVSSIIHMGCSFDLTGNTFFPNYHMLIPTIVHASGPGFYDGSVKVESISGTALTHTWQPGSIVSNTRNGAAAGAYKVHSEDSLHHTADRHYHVGYKMYWDSLYSCVAKTDTLETTGMDTWGRALSKNTLAAHTDGWFEYALKDLDKIKFIGFLDSMSTDPQELYDIDYGFNYYAIDQILYLFVKGVYMPIYVMGKEDAVLRVERIADTIHFKVNNVIVASEIDTIEARKPWKVKGIVHAWAGTRLANVGCSFNYILPLQALAVQQDVNCVPNANGSVTITPLGGVPPYTYALDNNAFTGTPAYGNLPAGEHTIKVKDFHNVVDTQTISILKCPKWTVPTPGASVNSKGDITKTAVGDSWEDANLVTEEPFVFADTAFWLSFEIQDTASVFMLGFRSEISDSSMQVSNYKLFIENGMATVLETDNDGFYTKFELSRTLQGMGFKVQLTKSGIEYYTRGSRSDPYELSYISKLFSTAKLIVESSLYKPGSKINAVRVSRYGNTN